MLDTASSTRSLRVSPAVSRGNDSYNTNPPSASVATVIKIIRTRGHVPRLLAATTIRGRRLFRSRTSDCVATIFEGGHYSRAASVQRNTVLQFGECYQFVLIWHCYSILCMTDMLYTYVYIVSCLTVHVHDYCACMHASACLCLSMCVCLCMCLWQISQLDQNYFMF